MTGGYAGKIPRINLTTKAISTIDTAKYEEFGGGFGGVFGAKNLKAISVTGTGSIKAADPKGVVDTLENKGKLGA